LILKALASLIGVLPILASAQTVAFTFDDGLDPRVQPKAAQWNDAMLSALRKAQLHAMVFPAGMNVDSPEGRALVAQWATAGHAIGNHTYSHWNLGLASISVQKFEADVLRGQKTGFFLDQRENRRRVEALAGGRTVLNAFSFSGGFSLYAARGGATGVTDLDISAHALKASHRNFALNQSLASVAAGRHERIQADAFDWLAGNARRRFDLVILDPPCSAKCAEWKLGWRTIARELLQR